MKRILLSMPVMAMTVGLPVAHGEVTDDQVKALEARVAQLEAEKPAVAPAPGDATPGHLKINGFMSAGFGRADIDGFSYDNGLYNQWSHNADSVVGLRFDAPVNAQVNAVTQLVARGSNDFAVDVDWAYIGYRPAAADEIRIGRQRFPLFMISEYLDVGYTYPWAKPPSEVYLQFLPSSYNGVSWHHGMSTGDWSHNLQVYWGTDQFQVNGGTFRLEDNAGIAWQSSRGNWQLGATYSHARTSFSNPFVDALSSAGVVAPLQQKGGWYGGAGLQYDNGSLLLMAEATEISVQGYFPDTTQEYVTLGYRFGKVMPHLTYASSQVIDHDQRPDSATIPAMCAGPGTFCLDPAGTVPFPANSLSRAFNSAQDSLTLGVRYDFLPNADVKLDWTHVLDTHGTFGLFSPQDGNVFYDPLPGNDINVYRVVVDVTF